MLIFGSEKLEMVSINCIHFEKLRPEDQFCKYYTTSPRQQIFFSLRNVRGLLNIKKMQTWSFSWIFYLLPTLPVHCSLSIPVSQNCHRFDDRRLECLKELSTSIGPVLEPILLWLFLQHFKVSLSISNPQRPRTPTSFSMVYNLWHLQKTSLSKNIWFKGYFIVNHI